MNGARSSTPAKKYQLATIGGAAFMYSTHLQPPSFPTLFMHFELNQQGDCFEMVLLEAVNWLAGKGEYGRMEAWI